ncbi:probably inactive leucine-rich repeat receptor-like protein kinase [Tanacetum coccineum]
MEKFICRMSLEDLKMATNNFDNKKVIGYGNMGLMYKAMFPNGLMLAVKRLHKFESFEKEFLLEIEILGRLRHTNLVPLLSFCYETEKKFLVYKYMCNGTLHQWLHFKPQVEGKKMGWTLRFKIAIGIARGLAWLHHNNVLRVAHLNISSKCILLDDKFEPKISNFGNSDILMNTSGIPSSVCNFVVPDSGPSPYKEDVYSFGILLLELITDTEPSTWINFPNHYVCSGELNVIDLCLMGQGFTDEINETLRVAEKCVQARTDGATSMLQVYQAMRAIGISRNGISIDSCIDVEDNEGVKGRFRDIVYNFVTLGQVNIVDWCHRLQPESFMDFFVAFPLSNISWKWVPQKSYGVMVIVGCEDSTIAIPELLYRQFAHGIDNHPRGGFSSGCDDDGGGAMMMIGGVVEGDGGMGMAVAVVATGDGEWRVAASGVVDRSGSTKL